VHEQRRVATVIEDVKKRSKPVKSNDEIAQVGTISANGEVEVGKFIAEAVCLPCVV